MHSVKQLSSYGICNEHGKEMIEYKSNTDRLSHISLHGIDIDGILMKLMKTRIEEYRDHDGDCRLSRQISCSGSI